MLWVCYAKLTCLQHMISEQEVGRTADLCVQAAARYELLLLVQWDDSSALPPLLSDPPSLLYTHAHNLSKYSYIGIYIIHGI